jgi:hypothetical protein
LIELGIGVVLGLVLGGLIAVVFVSWAVVKIVKLVWSRRDSMRLLLLKKDGLKLAEIAKMLKRTESAIKNQLFILRRELHEAA